MISSTRRKSKPGYTVWISEASGTTRSLILIVSVTPCSPFSRWVQPKAGSISWIMLLTLWVLVWSRREEKIWCTSTSLLSIWSSGHFSLQTYSSKSSSTPSIKRKIKSTATSNWPIFRRSGFLFNWSATSCSRVLKLILQAESANTASKSLNTSISTPLSWHLLLWMR